MPSLIADRPRLALAGGAVLACLVLFGVGFAVAPGASGDASRSRAPAVVVRPVQAAKPLRVGTLRALGTLPALRAPKRARRVRRSQAPARSSGGGVVTPRPVAPPVAPPPVAPAPVAPPPVAPPPPSCIGAGCDYG